MTNFVAFAYIAMGFTAIGFAFGFLAGYTVGMKDGIDLNR